MTHDELLWELNEDIKAATDWGNNAWLINAKALRAVVELHSPNEYGNCLGCPTHGEFACGLDNDWNYCPTIQSIEKVLNG